MTQRPDGATELLHRVLGSVSVARHMIERSAIAYRRDDRSADVAIVAGLFDAAEALRVVADALEAEILPRELVGPAA